MCVEGDVEGIGDDTEYWKTKLFETGSRDEADQRPLQLIGGGVECVIKGHARSTHKNSHGKQGFWSLECANL